MSDAAADPNRCSVPSCMPAIDGSPPPACDYLPGYGCALICPSPLGGCGRSPTCCRL